MHQLVKKTLIIIKMHGLYVKIDCTLRREEKPTSCHWMVYCTYNMLNMFWALLCLSSGAWDYMCVITACGVQCLVAGCRKSSAGQRAMCPGSARNMLSILQVQKTSQWHLVGFFFCTHMQQCTDKHTSSLTVLCFSSSRRLAASALCCLIMANLAKSARASSVFPSACNRW